MNHFTFQKPKTSFTDYSANKIKNSNRDWKKIITDKLSERVKQTHIYRMEYFLLNKTTIINDIISELDLTKEKEVLQCEFINDLLSSIENNNLLYKDNTKILECPLCFQPIVFNNNNVKCINQCVNIDIQLSFLNSQFTLIDLLALFKQHKEMRYCDCNEILNAEIIDNQITLICSKCWNN